MFPMNSKCTIKGSDNCVIQNDEQAEENTADHARNTWSFPAVTILCVFHFLLGVAAYKWVLWRWIPYARIGCMRRIPGSNH